MRTIGVRLVEILCSKWKEGLVVIWLAALMMLLFYGLAVCTIGGMMAIGMPAELAMVTAVLVVTIGVIIARAMHRAAR